MDPLPKIEGCSCTRRTRSNKGPVFLLQESRACVFGCVFTSWPHKLAIFSLNPDPLACLLLEQKLVEGNPNKDKS